MDGITYIPYGACVFRSNSILPEEITFYSENLRRSMQNFNEMIPSISKAEIAYLYFITARNSKSKKSSSNTLYAPWGILVFSVTSRKICSCEIAEFDNDFDKALNTASMLIKNAVSPTALKDVLDDVRD